MLSSTLLILSSFQFLLDVALAAPGHSSPAGQFIPLLKRHSARRAVEDWGAWAKKERVMLEAKYGSTQLSKRDGGTNLMINQASDGSYLGSIAIGTPPTAFYVALDTGSTDLWVSNINCNGCSNASSYNSAASSTFQNLSKSFSVEYGDGKASGSLVADVVQMAGFEVRNQSFGAVTVTSKDLVDIPVSGLMGLGWKGQAPSAPMPFWQTLASQGAWSEPVMAFQLTRFNNASNARSVEPGGSFTMGFLNTSLYTGNVDYQNLVTPPGHWILSLTNLTVQGSSVSLSSGSAAQAAIDTGTTNIAGPPSEIQKVYAKIPGSQRGSGDLKNHWIYPCDTQVNVTMSFGGRSWAIDPNDFRFAQIGPNKCVGAFFVVETHLKIPSWIIGDTFLKNVYSVFRYDPPSVGFASLSEIAVNMNGVDEQLPSTTAGSIAASATATGGHDTSGASWTLGSVFESLVVACGVAAGVMLL